MNQYVPPAQHPDFLPASPRSAFGSQRLGLVAVQLLLPMILANITIGNQLWQLGPFIVGQFFFWFAMILAALVLIDGFRGAFWPYALVMAVPIVRLLDAVVGSGATTTLYFVTVNGLFLLAAIIAAIAYPALIRRQVNFFLGMCLPLMMLQVAGAGEWTQILNTERFFTEDHSDVPEPLYSTLFTPYDHVDFHYNIVQGRPAGLLHSNNVLSLIIILGFALQLGQARRAKATWSDVVLVGCMVLAMAKIVLLCVFIIVAWTFMRGPVYRQRALQILLITAICFGLYALLFPGMFEMQLSAYKIMYSISVRVFDLLEVFSGLSDSQRAVLVNMMGDAQAYVYGSDEDVGKLSGYAMILNYWPLLVAAAVVFIPLFFMGYARLRARAPIIAATAIVASIAVVLYPAAVPFFRAQLYWFVFGFAAAPFIYLVAPRFAQELIERGRRDGWGAPG